MKLSLTAPLVFVSMFLTAPQACANDKDVDLNLYGSWRLHLNAVPRPYWPSYTVKNAMCQMLPEN